jgi:hypothetical protein
MLRLLSQAEIWNCDGTFVSSPKLYQQTYIIHTFFKDECYPCIYINLKNKDKASYTKMLKIIKNLAKTKYNLDLNPKVFFGDFEDGAIKAFYDSFPGIQFKGCFFHFCQALWRKIMKLGLFNQYTNREDTSVFRWLQLFKGLAFLPLEKFVEGLDYIIKNTPNCNKCTEFQIYFISTWGNDKANFPPHMWNHWDTYRDRTNNPVEGINLGKYIFD